MSSTLRWCMRCLWAGCFALTLMTGAQAGEAPQKKSFSQDMAGARAALAGEAWEEARKGFVAALRHRPDDADARFGLGRANRELKRHHEARRQFRLALAARPADAAWEGRCRTQIAGCWEDAGEYREALLEHRLALKADPDLASDVEAAGARADNRAEPPPEPRRQR